MKTKEYGALRRYCGDPNMLCGIRDVVYNDGTAKGVRAFEMDNGNGITMTVAADRGLDIPYLKFKGVNVGMLGRSCLRTPLLYHEDGARGFLRQFYGGALTTGGLSYAGAACEEDGAVLGLHGNFDNTPAERVHAWTDTDGEEVLLKVAGDVVETQQFSVDLIAKREITLDTERNEVHITDTVVNRGFSEAPLMLLYHTNFGYPLLAPGAKVYTNAKTVTPRTEFAREGMPMYDVMEEPGVEREEQCYFHTDFEDEPFAMLHNEALGMAGIVRFDKDRFPELCEWKCMRAGDYALGLEPTTAGVLSRSEARAKGILQTLAAGEERVFHVTLEYTDDPERIAAYKARAVRQAF